MRPVFVFLVVLILVLLFFFTREKEYKYLKFTNTPNGLFYYDEMDNVIAESFKNGKVYEEYIINNIIKKYIINSDIIIDMGANIGSHTISYGNMNKTCTIHSFEPQKQLFKILKKNCQVNNLTDRVKLYNKAIGHEHGYFYLDSIPDDEPYNKGGVKLGKNGERVEMITLDSLNLTGCDFIKMDIQGSEPLALLGGEQTIRKYKPIIFFEYVPELPDVDIIPEEIGLTSIPDTIEVLNKLGYTKIEKIDYMNFIAEP